MINGEHYAGAERVQDLLAQCLPEFGFSVVFACVKPGKFPTAMAASGVTLAPIEMNSRLDFSIIGRVEELARRSNVALIHTHTPRTSLIGRIVAQRLKLPFVHHIHSPAAQDSERWLMNHANALVEGWSIRRCARLVAVSQSLKTDMVGYGVSPRRVSVVYNGVPCMPGRAARSAHETTWTLGVVGLFRPRKGIEVLLGALQRLRKWGLAVRLRAIGPFESEGYELGLKKMAVELGVADAVEWLSFTPRLDTFYAQTDLLVLPSLYGEGTPMVVLEAMAAGVPVVGTRVGGVPELIRDGVDGLVVAPGRPEELANGIRRIVSGEVSWGEMSESARARQHGSFSDRVMAEGVARVYQETLQ